MKPKTINPQLTEFELDTALHQDQDLILPTSGFTESVMTAIRREAAAPPPIPFPWRRALPGLIVAALVLAALIAAVVHLLHGPASASSPSGIFLQAELAPLLRSASATDSLWVLFSLALSTLCLFLCRRFVRAR